MITLNEKSAVVYMTGNEGDLYSLKQAFEFPHPQRDRIDLYVWYKRTLDDKDGPKGWNGMVSPIKIRQGQAEFLRGYRELVVAKAAELKIKVGSSSKFLNSPFSSMTTDDIAGDCISGDFELDENQREVIAAWLRHGTGIGNICTGGGKTACFAGFASTLKSHIDEARFLYVTDRERLTSQVDREMQRFLPGWDITKYGGNGKDNTGKDMVVCTLAMLRVHYSELVMDGWFDTFNAVLFDECVSGDTQITLRDGSFTTAAEIVAAGRKVSVLTLNEKTGEVEPKNAVGYAKGQRETLVITAENGVQLRCTSNHPIFTQRGWVAAGELKLNDFVVREYDERTNSTGLRQPSRGCLNEESGAVNSSSVDNTAQRETVCSCGSQVPSNKKHGWNAAQRMLKRGLGRPAHAFQHVEQPGIFRHLPPVLSWDEEDSDNDVAGKGKRAWNGVVVYGRRQSRHSRNTPIYREFFGGGTPCFASMVHGPMGDTNRNYTFQKKSLVFAFHKNERRPFLPDNRALRYPGNAIQVVHNTGENLRLVQQRVHPRKWADGILLGALLHPEPTGLLRSLVLSEPAESAEANGRYSPVKAGGKDVRGVRAKIYDAKKAPNSVRESVLLGAGSPAVEFVRIRAIEKTGTFEEVFDLTVDGNHNYFANGFLVHNCHHAQSEQAMKIMLAINGAFFRIGASATTKADDPLAQMQITGLLGPVRTVVEQKELIDVGRSAVPHVYIVDVPEWEDKFCGIPYSVKPNTPSWVLLSGEDTMRKGIYKGPVYETKEDGSIQMKKTRVLEGVHMISAEVPVVRPGLHTIEIDGVDYEIDSSYCLLNRAVDKAIIQFKERNDLVVEWAKYFSDQGKRTLVVATRTMHVLILEALMFDAVDPDLVQVLVGEDSKSKRDRTFDWFKATPGAVLISPLLKEGVSINELEAGVIADFVADSEVMNQLVGRFLRKKEDENVAELVLFVDRQQRRFKVGCQTMLKKLSKQSKGAFVFYYPVVHPQDIEASKIFDTTAEIEFHRDEKRVFRGLEV
jgi:superfamily II DNA or RNA helicase